jgi:hypothetical protein
MGAYSAVSEALTLALKERKSKQSGKSSVKSIVGGYLLDTFQTLCATTTCEQSESTISHELTSSAEDFPARTSLKLDTKSEFMGTALVFGLKCTESFVRLDPELWLWRTWQRCLNGEWSEFLGTWPEMGLMRNGVCYPLVNLVRHTHAPECSSWPTPLATDWKETGNVERMAKHWTHGEHQQRPQHRFAYEYGKAAPVALQEWLMGYPIGWTDLEQSETPSSLKSQSGLGDE